ncbi:MAG: hypothetical protein KA715_00145 [Xanthomonadaceae bacterium]|nr:hypothetical protein [Xanthomonadaceae bacterium]
MKSIFFLFLAVHSYAQDTTIKLRPGYVYKFHCSGKLILSAVGNEQLVERASLPADSGCGLIIKPLTHQGDTNLWIETTTGSFEVKLEITSKAGKVTSYSVGGSK